MAGAGLVNPFPPNQQSPDMVRSNRLRAGSAVVAAVLGTGTVGVLAADGAAAMGYVAIGAFLVANAALLSRRRPGVTARIAYVVFACVATVTVVHTDQNAWFVLVLLVPQIFAFVDPISAASAAALVLLVAVSVVSGSSRADEASLLSNVVAGVVALAASIATGLFVKALLRETRRRGQLIRDLEAAHSELARVQHAAGVTDERSRLTREIHDTLAQGFTSLLTLLQAADASLDTDVLLTRQRLELAQQTARDNLDEARALVTGSAPEVLRDHATTTAAVRRLADTLRAELGVPVTLTVTGSDTETHPSTASQVVVVRVLQEAFANIRKHAMSPAVQIDLEFESGWISLHVADNGTGFDSSTPTEGLGLDGMRDRVHTIGGTFTLETSLGSGSTIRARVPA